MHGFGRRLAVVFVLTIVVVGTLRSQEPEKRFRFTGDIGVVNTAGNTRVTTINVGDELGYRIGKVLLTQTFALVYGKSEGELTTNSQVARGRAEFAFSDKVSGYTFVGYERNRFAGISRRTDEGVGLAVKVLRGERTELDLEAGVGLVQDVLYPDPALDPTISDHYASGRAAGRFKYLFAKTSYLQQSLEFLANLEESRSYRINSETALVAPLSSHIALKIAYLIKFNNAPPSPDLVKTDRMLTSGIQVSY